MLTDRFKTLFTLLWILLVAGALLVWQLSGVEVGEVPDRLDAWLSRFGLIPAALLYIVLYAVRPLIFFPATILTVASGLVFGPWLGILFTVVGENASANVAFVIARWLGRDWVSAREHRWVNLWDRRIQENALVAVMVMRLLYLPFDAVNYGCGLTGMRQRDYFIGTFIGIIPGLVSFVLLGGSAAAGVENRLALLGVAVFFFFLGLVIARAVRRLAPDPKVVGAAPPE